MTSEPALDKVVDQTAELLHQRIGLRPEQTLRSRLRRCIRDESTHYAVEPAAYLQIVSAQEEALQRLVNRVTVQETGFFRHPEHFGVLAGQVLPKLPTPLTLWSAGCANGQEAYTLAMVLEEQQLAGSVLATDLSTAALLRTNSGRYSAREVSGLSPARLARHFTATGDTWTVNDALRRRVAVQRHNLLDPLPEAVRSCQVVFCRNVLIYFTPDHARTFLDRLADDLPAASYLFLGSAETVWPISNRFATLQLAGTFLYRSHTEPAPRPSFTARRPVTARPARPAVPPRRPRVPALAAVVPEGVDTDPVDDIAVQVLAGRQALDAGQVGAAIVAFRKWAFLAPDDAMAYLHLALALEAAGDRASAHHAYGAASRAVRAGDRSLVAHKIGGYAPDELLRLLDAKSLATER